MKWAKMKQTPKRVKGKSFAEVENGRGSLCVCEIAGVGCMNVCHLVGMTDAREMLITIKVNMLPTWKMLANYRLEYTT